MSERPGHIPLWIRITLLLSLAVNLLIAGVVIGAAPWRDGPAERRDRDVAGDLAPAPFVLALEPGDRRQLMDEFRALARPHRPDRRALRRQLESLVAALRSESFDGAMLTGLAARQRDLSQTRQAIGADIMARHLAAMSPEARRAYADRLEQALRRGARAP